MERDDPFDFGLEMSADVARDGVAQQRRQQQQFATRHVQLLRRGVQRGQLHPKQQYYEWLGQFLC